MKRYAKHLYQRGQTQVFYCRRRIPEALRRAYPERTREIVRCLGTTDAREAEKHLRAELVRIDGEFEAKARELALQRKRFAEALQPRRLEILTDDYLQALAGFWVRQVLLTDDAVRAQGLEPEAFDALGAKLVEQREELGRMLARGDVSRVMPALQGFMHLCGLEVALSPGEAQRAGYAFLRAVVGALDHRLARQVGALVDTDRVAPDSPQFGKVAAKAAAGSATWEKVFQTWIDYVTDRPRGTVIAAQTAWREFVLHAKGQGLRAPAELTLEHVSGYVERMADRGLARKTINGRLGRVRVILKVAVGKSLLKTNPAANALGFQEAASTKGRAKRLPFTLEELQLIFSSWVFIEHLRSEGGLAEACYWIPILMHYTGARPEELAGLPLEDILYDSTHGWYLHITDLPSDEDDDLLDENDEAPAPEKRRLKNAMSRRRVPLADEVIALGFVRYRDWLRAAGHTMLFPTLTPDFHGKLGGAFSKWFGRYKVRLGVTSGRKVLYSLRHNMKDMLERAEVPSKVLKRILGHATGDGAVTDGYGSDLPLDVVAGWFKKITFPKIPALAWDPGKGPVPRKNAKAPTL